MIRIDNYRLSEEKESKEIEDVKYELRLLDKHILHLQEILFYYQFNYERVEKVSPKEETSDYANVLIICKVLKERLEVCKERETLLYNDINELRTKQLKQLNKALEIEKEVELKEKLKYLRIEIDHLAYLIFPIQLAANSIASANSDTCYKTEIKRKRASELLLLLKEYLNDKYSELKELKNE